jgi:hypothetical protein
MRKLGDRNMSEELEKIVEDEVLEDAQDESIDEAKKASAGDPSEIPEPTAATAKAPGKSKNQGDKAPPAQGSSVKPATKMAMLNAAMSYLGNMKKAELEAMMQKSGMMGTDTEEGVHKDKTKKEGMHKEEVVLEKVTREDFDITDDVAAIFAGSEVSEEFVAKATEIFETAVVAKVNDKLAEVAEVAESELAESTEVFNKELVDKVDSYLDYVVESWMEENKLAVDSGLRGEIAESFIGGLKNLFQDHYIDIPEEKVDVVEELANKVEELEAKLNESIEETIELKKKNEEFERAVVFAEEIDGLTETQIAKMESLSKAVEFDSEEDFRDKLKTIRENYFDGPKEVITETAGLDDEPIEIDDEEPATPKGAMGAYVASITRQVKK